MPCQEPISYVSLRFVKFCFVSFMFGCVWEVRSNLEIPGQSTHWPRSKGHGNVHTLAVEPSTWGVHSRIIWTLRTCATPWVCLLRVTLRLVTFQRKRLRFVTFEVTFRYASLRHIHIYNVKLSFSVLLVTFGYVLLVRGF